MPVQMSNYNAAHLKLLIKKKNSSGTTKKNEFEKDLGHIYLIQVLTVTEYFSNTLANIQSYIALLLFLLTMNFILELLGIKQSRSDPWKTQQLGALIPLHKIHMYLTVSPPYTCFGSSVSEIPHPHIQPTLYHVVL